MGRRVARLWVAAALWIAALGPAHAQAIWDPSALVRDMFPSADHMVDLPVVVDAERSKLLRKEGGAWVPAATYHLQAAYQADVLLGYVIFDQQVGQHEPISFAVQLDAKKVVLRQEVVTYRERYGSGVTDARFRSQFVGMTAADPITAGKDVQIVSGATYSSKAMAIGVKRAVLLAAMLPAPAAAPGAGALAP